jgi:CRISPR-associated RAMP protein (TIGR02581 family)
LEKEVKMGFEKLIEIACLTVKYTNKSTLSISMGKQSGEIVESPVVKIGGKPVIPGSSLKGAIRSTLEAMLAALDQKVCIPFAAIPRAIRQKREEVSYAASIGRIAPCANITQPCPVCSLFGTVGGQTGLSGKAIVSDARIENGSYELIQRSHVAITRNNKSQSEGSLMTIEAVDAGTVFTNSIRVLNPENWQVGAIIRALEGVELMGMGAKKTAGYGEMEIKFDIDKSIMKKFDGRSWHETTLSLPTLTLAFGEKFGK